jgi:four helix bundle protein
MINPNHLIGTLDAPNAVVNPRAEALKKRTFDFALRIVRCCRDLRQTWEGREFSDQIFRSGTRVGANYRSVCRARSHDDFVAKLGHVVEESDEGVYWLELIAAAQASADPELPALIEEANELSAIFNQSQFTARMNQAAQRSQAKNRQSPGRPSGNRQSTNPQSKSPNS